MAYAVFNDGATDGREPWVDYEFTDEPFVEDLGEKAPGRTERVELFACSRRRYRWPAGLTEAQRVAWEAFLQARGILRDAFLVEDPRDPVRELVALEPAVGDGARVTFSLPTNETSPDFRWYPKQGTVVGYVNGRPFRSAVQHHHEFGMWRMYQSSQGQKGLSAKHLAALGLGLFGVSAVVAGLKNRRTRRAASR